MNRATEYLFVTCLSLGLELVMLGSPIASQAQEQLPNGHSHSSHKIRKHQIQTSDNDLSSTSQPDTLPRVVLDYYTRNTYLEFPPKTGETQPKRLSLSQGLCDGEHFAVRVLNVNKYRYRVKVTATGESLFRTVPDAFKQFVISANPAPKKLGAELVLSPEDQLANLEFAISLITGLGTQLQSIVNPVRENNGLELAKTQARSALLTTFESLKSQEGDIMIGDKSLQEMTLEELKNLQPADLLSVTDQLFSKLPILRKSFEDELAAEKDPAKQSLIKSNIDRVTKLETDKPTILTNIRQVVELAQSAINKDYMQTDLGPFQVNDDNTKVSITVTEITSTGGISADSETIDLGVPTSCGAKIDFSAGLLVTSLVDHKYTTTSLGNNQFRINQSTSDTATLATVAMTHFYWRIPGQVQIGPSLGIAVRDNPIYALGLSLLVGRRQRFAFTAGIAIGKVSRLSEGHNVGDTISTSTAPVSDRYMSRPFFSLTYNF